MSWLDDLLNNARNTKLVKNAQQGLQNWGQQDQQGTLGHTGAWGLPDIGATELVQDMFVPTSARADTGGSNLLGSPSGSYASEPNSSQEIMSRDLSAPSGDTTGGGGGGGGTPTPTGGDGANDGGLGSQVALARAAYEQAIRGLQNAFGEARGVYDQGMGLVNKRRGEFKDIYDTGNADILSSFEGERGNLQRSSVGNKNRLRNILRATGMGGSALVRGIGSQDKANLRNLGNLSEEKTFNERENLRGYNTNQEWAGQQESALGRFLEGAQNRLQEGVGKAGLIQQGDVSGINNAFNQLRSNIYDQKAALEAARGNIGAYQVNPFAPNLSDMTNSLNLSIPSFGVDAGGANQAVNLAPENMSYLDLLKKRAGGSLYA